MLNIEKSTIRIGLEKPLKILHVTDSHLPLCDERDDARKQALAERLGGDRKEKIEYLNEQLAYAEANCDLLLHTGDLVDFVSKANVDYARALLKNERILFIAGNHDYSQYVGEAWEDTTYKMNSYMMMGEGLGVDMFYTSRIVGGVNLVGVDNSYHQAEDWQTERLQMEVRKGLPIVLFMHVPLFEQSLYERGMEHTGNESAYIMGCDEEHLMQFTEFRSYGQRPTEATKRFVEYVNSQPLIRAVIAGHLHFSFESTLPGGAVQFVTDGGYRGAAREITIV